MKRYGGVGEGAAQANVLSDVYIRQKARIMQFAAPTAAAMLSALDEIAQERGLSINEEPADCGGIAEEADIRKEFWPKRVILKGKKDDTQF